MVFERIMGGNESTFFKIDDNPRALLVSAQKRLGLVQNAIWRKINAFFDRCHLSATQHTAHSTLAFTHQRMKLTRIGEDSDCAGLVQSLNTRSHNAKQDNEVGGSTAELTQKCLDLYPKNQRHLSITVHNTTSKHLILSTEKKEQK